MFDADTTVSNPATPTPDMPSIQDFKGRMRHRAHSKNISNESTEIITPRLHVIDAEAEIVTPTLNNQEDMENNDMNSLRNKRLTSIVAINLFCIGNTVQSIIYKLLAA